MKKLGTMVHQAVTYSKMVRGEKISLLYLQLFCSLCKITLFLGGEKRADPYLTLQILINSR